MRVYPTAILLVLVLFVCGCGYTIGTRKVLVRGLELKRIAIPLVKNRSSQPGAEVSVTRALRIVFHRNGAIRVVSGGAADAVMVARITDVTLAPVAAAIDPLGLLQLVHYRVTMRLQLKLIQPETRETIWQMTSLNAHEDFLTGKLPVETEANKLWAIERVARRLAEKAYTLICSGF